jgi:tetratricopeptide (TPR) repeat protein
VAALCGRLDGLPLAIELAAARSAHFTPAELLSAFPSRLDLGADGPVNVDARQRTLRDTIAWSFHLLTPAEQQLFTRLAIFEGGWTAEAATQVCGGGQSVSEGLATLRDASLIANNSGAQPRWRMLETIREYLMERAAQYADLDKLQGQHARYYLALAESLPAYAGTRDGQVIAVLDLEYDNLRAALRWLLAHDPSAALRLSGVLWPFWLETGRLAEGDRWLRATLEPEATPPAVPRARALTGLTILSSSLGDYRGALALSEHALALAAEVGDLASLASVETYRGLMAQHGGDLSAGYDWCQRALGHWRAANAPLGEARCHSELALISAMRGDWTHWQKHIDAAEALYRREQDAIGLARSLNDRGFVAMAHGDYPRAIELLLEGVERARENTFSSTHGGGLLYLGLAQQFAGQLDAAWGNLTEALRGFRDAGDALFVSYCLIGLAGSASLYGQPVRAAELCGAGLAAQAAVGLVMPPMVRKLYEAGVSTIRAQIDDATFAAAFERGRQLPIQEAIAYALADPSAS